MKVAERVLDVDSTLTGEKVRMGIDEAALQHIIGVLTDLYSDPELAVIREYSTNALDAHAEAGNSAPIEVTTPTNLAPFFRVKDRGIGLDAEGIRSIYSKYGMSTKRDTDEQVGMLGLGCKSALTYTDQFTLIGTKDGRQVQVQIGRDEDGGGSMTIVSDEPTDEPNGVEVIVPVKRDNGYESKAHSFFRFWKKGTVLLNGEEPEDIRDAADPTWLIPDRLFVYNPTADRYYRNQYYRYRTETGWAVMGNVAYPLPEDFMNDRAGRLFSVVAFVDIGEVNFTPSREALMLTKRTKETLARIEADVTRELANAAQKRVAEAATPADAIRLTQEAAAMGVKTDGIKYQGRDVPVELRRSTADTTLVGDYGPTNTWLVLGWNEYDYYAQRKKNGGRYRSIPPYNSNRVVFTGYESKELSLAKRNKLEAWFKLKNLDYPKQLLFVDKLTSDERFWLTGTPIYDWTQVQEIKLEKSGTVGTYMKRPRGSYEHPSKYRIGGNAAIEAENIDTSNPILWVSTDERYLDLSKYGTIPSDATIVVLPQNRREKFKRDFPTAMQWQDYLRKEAKDWLDKQDAQQIEVAKFHMSGVGDSLLPLDAAKVDDPELAAAITKRQTKVDDLIRGIESRARWLDGFESYRLSDKIPHPLKKYPLVYGADVRRNAEHFYLYVNAAYAA